MKSTAEPALCRRSEIRIPNDQAFARAAARFVVEVALLTGFEEPELRSIEQGVLNAVTALIRYSFEPEEDASLTLSCEHISEGLRVRFHDKGLPFGAAEMSTDGRVCAMENGSELCSRILALKGEFEEISLHNLGPEGKETVLIKHLKRSSPLDRNEACDLRAAETEPPAAPFNATRWKVRQMLPSEAPEISKLIYKTYGYTYHDYAYFPEKIVAMNESGRLHSIVAIAEGKTEIAGHCVLQFHDENPLLGEMAQAVVKPEYRSQGCLQAMTEYLLGLVNERQLHGLFTKSVTEHLFSQKTSYRFGFNDCAVLLGILPQETPFKGMVPQLSQRGSLLVQFLSLRRTPPDSCFAPSRHREMLERLYLNVGIDAEIAGIEGSPKRGKSALKTQAFGRMRFARMVIERSGRDIVSQVQTALKELLVQKFETVQLYLNLGDPSAGVVTNSLEDLGFFFAGLLPKGFIDGDALILQFLNNVPLDYSEIHVGSETARELLGYIKANDPNQG